MKKIYRTMALAIALAVPAAAHAQPEDRLVRTTSVAYGDLNLQTESGRATFRSRVNAAADRVCGPIAVIPLAEAMDSAKCRAGVTNEAEVQIAGVLPQARLAAVR